MVCLLCVQGGSSLASSLDSSLTLCGFGGDYMGDEDALLEDVLLPDEDLLDLAPDEPTMKVRLATLGASCRRQRGQPVAAGFPPRRSRGNEAILVL